MLLRIVQLNICYKAYREMMLVVKPETSNCRGILVIEFTVDIYNFPAILL